MRLVRLGEGTRDTRRRAALSELRGRGETEAQVLAVLRRFSVENARLVTLGADGAETVAEVTHEALFEHWTELRKWIDEGRADRRLHDRATEAARLWDAAKRPPGPLRRRPDLDLLQAYDARKPEELSPLLGAFLTESKAQQRRDTAVRWGSVLAVFLAMVVAGGVYVTKERQRVHESRLRFQALADSAERSRQQYLDTYVERARQLLLEEGSLSEAVLRLQRAQIGKSTNPLLPDLMHRALLNLEATRVVLVGHEQAVWIAAYSPDGKRIVTASVDKTVRVWDADSGRPLAVLQGHQNVFNTAAYSPDGKRIVTASSDLIAQVWDVAPESRTAAEIDQVIRCRLFVRFASDDSDVIVPALPNPGECLPPSQPPPSH